MCLAVPAKVIEISGDGTGVVEVSGAHVRASLALVDGVKVDDYVLVHAGHAIEIIDREEAKKTLELFEELARLDEIQ